jgi:hypothetical protein
MLKDFVARGVGRELNPSTASVDYQRIQVVHVRIFFARDPNNQRNSFPFIWGLR